MYKNKLVLIYYAYEIFNRRGGTKTQLKLIVKEHNKIKSGRRKIE